MLPTPEHVLYIPGVFLAGLVAGWIAGARAARRSLDARRERLRD
jgi:hypothetical protein